MNRISKKKVCVEEWKTDSVNEEWMHFKDAWEMKQTRTEEQKMANSGMKKLMKRPMRRIKSKEEDVKKLYRCREPSEFVS